MAVGSRGAIVTGYTGVQHLRTGRGDYVRRPPVPRPDVGRYSTAAVNATGTVAYAAATDGLVHFLACS